MQKKSVIVYFQEFGKSPSTLPNTACSNPGRSPGQAVLKVKIKTTFKRETLSISGQRRLLERSLIAHHGVQDGQELPHTRDESHLLHLAPLQQLLILRLDQRVVPRRHQG